MEPPESYMYYMETFSPHFQLVLPILFLSLTWKMGLENGLEALNGLKHAIKKHQNQISFNYILFYHMYVYVYTHIYTPT